VTTTHECDPCIHRGRPPCRVQVVGLGGQAAGESSQQLTRGCRRQGGVGSTAYDVVLSFACRPHNPQRPGAHAARADDIRGTELRIRRRLRCGSIC
jgi:hypothetical protein